MGIHEIIPGGTTRLHGRGSSPRVISPWVSRNARLAILKIMTGPDHCSLAGEHAGWSRQALWISGLEVLEPGGERGDLSGLEVNQGLADGLEAGIRRDDSNQPAPIRGGTRLKLAERLR